MSSKTSCIACDDKDTMGIFTCAGCSEAFCCKHANEHRYLLKYQLDEIILEHENIFNTFNNNKQESSCLLDQINQWEKNSIEKIQQTAQDARLQIQRFAQEEKEQIIEKSHQMTKQLANARKRDEYLEHDLARWKILLEQLNYDLNTLSPSITLHQDPDHPFLPKLFIAKVNQQSTLYDSLVTDSNHIQFDDQHHMAMHCGPYRTPAYISGTQEYTTGQHQIRFFISKKTSAFILSFNIISKLMDLSSTSAYSQFLTYGWQSDDCINPSQSCASNEKAHPDLKGKTKFHIRLLMDCDKQTIAYVNEKSKRKREIHVDVNKCPLPWKLYFYLYDVGDTVRLLSSSQITEIV